MTVNYKLGSGSRCGIFWCTIRTFSCSDWKKSWTSEHLASRPIIELTSSWI